ncbi:SMC-Scp complex subunit ScpB [Enemella sp. A6]|uniref:SMC-Scp complex subunit ScpB n=1 Tax=Enemella sp. A6 TaxID=3440152 RepID=UPI003EBCF31B
MSDEVAPLIEALLLMATEPVSELELAEACERPVDEVRTVLAELQEFYDSTGRGFALRNVGGGWRYWTRPEYAEAIGRHLLEGQHAKLSKPALETLSVIAYLQPVSRSRIAAVRGVNVDGVVRTLISRGLVDDSGRDEDTGAGQLVTTPLFLERMGLGSLDELPPLAPHLPEVADLEAELSQLADLDTDGGEAPATDGSPQPELSPAAEPESRQEM